MRRPPASQWGLQSKMLGAFVFSALTTLTVALVSFFAIRALVGRLTEIGHHRMVASEKMLEASTKIGDLGTLLREELSYTITAEERSRIDNAITVARGEYRAAAERAKPNLDADELKKFETFLTQTKEWADTNDQIRAKLRALAETKLDAPLILQSQLEGFRADHLQVLATAQKQVAKGASYEGGTDHNACRFGRWLSSYKTQNAKLLDAMRRSAEPHEKFHASVLAVQQHLKNGQVDEARKIIDTLMAPSVEGTVAMLKELQAEPAAAVATLNELQRIFVEVSNPQAERALASVTSIVEQLNQQTSAAIIDADKLATTAKTANIVATIAGTIVALFLGMFVARRIAGELRAVASELGSCSEQTTSVATQIATVSQDLASSSSQQASSLEETSAALEELSGTTNQNADRSRSANARAAAARGTVERGATQMRELQSAMSSIQESSAEITKIVKTIDEIAFQTNLLALNAAVEAARAGEAGAGFAIVADEVRSLAHRSAAAAKETTSLVDNAHQRSERGAVLATEVSKNLEEILNETRSVDSLVGGITSASNEQSVGVEQIKKTAIQLDQLVQANAATAEENASAAEELQGQTVGMHEMVQRLLRIVNGGSDKNREAISDPSQHETISRKPATRPRAKAGAAKS